MLSEDLKKLVGTSGQDGGVGRHTVPPCTTKTRPTNLKTKNNQNQQKIELYGSLTTKKLKKKHSTRPVGSAETVSQVERMHSKVVAGGLGQARWRQADQVRRQLVDGRSHICVQIN